MLLVLKFALGVMIGQVIGRIVTAGINRLGSLKGFKFKESPIYCDRLDAAGTMDKKISSILQAR